MATDSDNNVWVYGRDVDTSVSTTRNLPCLRKFSPTGTLLYTYTDRTAGQNGLSIFDYVTEIECDSRGNVIINAAFRIYVLYMSSTPFVYKGVTYTSGQLIPYVGNANGNFGSGQMNTLVSYNNTSSFFRIKLDSTRSILYAIVYSNSNILAIPYIIPQ